MQTKATRLRELTLRYAVRKRPDGEPLTLGPSLCTPTDAAHILLALLADEPVEVFGILCLTTKRRLIGYHEVSRGQLDATLVHPREVFKVALLANAAAIVLAHNHPSGDPTPSDDDRQLTRRLVAAGEVLGVEVLDHIVVGDAEFVSLRHAGPL
jgi:DNA repair protein RadC